MLSVMLLFRSWAAGPLRVQAGPFDVCDNLVRMLSYNPDGYYMCVHGSGGHSTDLLSRDVMKHYRDDRVMERLVHSIINSAKGREALHPLGTKEGQLVMDVGANVGWFSLFCASLGVPRTIAVEPFHKNADLLRQSIKINRFDGNMGVPEIMLFNLAASASTHALYLYEMAGNFGGTFVSTNPKIGQKGVTQAGIVAAAQLQDLVPAQAVWLLKLDCEGHESMALQGMRHYFETQPPLIRNIIMEMKSRPNETASEPQEGSALQIALTYFLARGYRLYALKHDWDFWSEGLEDYGNIIDPITDLSELVEEIPPAQEAVAAAVRKHGHFDMLATLEPEGLDAFRLSSEDTPKGKMHWRFGDAATLPKTGRLGH